MVIKYARTATGTPETASSIRARRRRVTEKVAELRKKPDVDYAVPNYIARTSFVPNDPGFDLQWNFRDGFGIEMPSAWDIARARGAPGGRGAVVAVLDTGVAYRRTGRFRRAPDLRPLRPRL